MCLIQVPGGEALMYSNVFFVSFRMEVTVIVAARKKKLTLMTDRCSYYINYN